MAEGSLQKPVKHAKYSHNIVYSYLIHQPTDYSNVIQCDIWNDKGILRLVSIADRKARSKLGLRPPANFCHCDAGVSIQVAVVSTANLPSCGGRESGHYQYLLAFLEDSVIVHVTLCYLSHKRVRPKLYLQNKGALRTWVFGFHTSQQPHEFHGCSQKLNMCDMTANIADLPRTSQNESQPCFHIHRRRKPVAKLASLEICYGN